MKKIGIVLVALAAILVLPGAAKADSVTYNNASGDFFGSTGFGSFSSSSLGPGSQSFLFSSNSIQIGSGQTEFTGNFTSGFTATNVSCGFLCTQYTASFVGTGASAGETGSITLDVNLFGQIVGGSADPNSPNTGVPEPGTLGMFAAGLLGIGLMISRRAKAGQVTA